MKKLSFFLLLLLVSCNSNTVYTKMHRGFDNNRWVKGEGETFVVDINQTIEGSITVKFAHIYEPQYSSVPITVHIKKPDGQEELLNAEMVLKDASGKDISDCLGDICDLDYVVSKKYPFTKGTYTITIQNNFSGGIYLPNVLGVGLEIGQEL